MNALVVYASRFGNTMEVARAVGAELVAHGSVRIADAATVPTLAGLGVDLLVVGAPTQRHGIPPAMAALLRRTPPDALRGVAVLVFDTRYRRARWLTGSAAGPLGRALEGLGGRLLARPASFFVLAREGPLTPGETARARAWAAGALHRASIAG